MKNLKAYQREQLFLEFGILIQPFDDLSKKDDPPSENDYRVAVAQVRAGDGDWRLKVQKFTTFSKDLVFQQEFQDISHIPEQLWGKLRGLIDGPILTKDPAAAHERFKRELETAIQRFHRLVGRVPITWEPEIFEANTPYTSYLRIKECVAVVNERINYFDRYLNPDFYQLFLRSVSKSVSIRLVTTAGNSRSGIKAVTPVSDLFRKEFLDYALIEVDHNDLHDRNLRVDDQVFSLGPGVDRAGIALTNFGPSDSSPSAQSGLDEIIKGGRVVHKSS